MDKAHKVIISIALFLVFYTFCVFTTGHQVGSESGFVDGYVSGSKDAETKRQELANSMIEMGLQDWCGYMEGLVTTEPYHPDIKEHTEALAYCFRVIPQN